MGTGVRYVAVKLVASTLVLSCFALGSAALQPGIQSSGAATPRISLITAGTARSVFTSLWPKFALAYATGDQVRIDQYTDTDLQEAIQGWFECGCGPLPTAYDAVNMTAPPQETYPISFLAEVQGKDYAHQPDVIEAVFSKGGPNSPWQITYLVSYIDSAPLLSTTTINVPAPKVSANVAAVGDQIASLWQTVFNTGQISTTWPQTGALEQEISRVMSDREYIAQNGFSEKLTYSAGPHSLAFANPQGDLMCGEIRSHSVITSATSGGVLAQPADQSVFGPQLPAGTYSSIQSTSLRDACWGVTPGGLTQPISFFGGVYDRTGVPTSSGSLQSPGA